MSQSTKKVGILGYGEVGRAIGEFYDTRPAIKDLALGANHFPLAFPFDVLHVCIPWSKTFIQTTVDAIRDYAPNGLVFIHSTVPVGTTRHVAEAAKHGFVVHVPIRGVHPKLKEGIETFKTYVGANSAGAARLACEHLAELGIAGTALRKSEASELLKLLDTTYYGLCIAYHDYAAKLCEREGVNFDVVMRDANDSYNAGYTKLGKSNVVRPVLYPPEDGKIGGHCVIPNAHILEAQFGADPLLEAILRHE